MKLNVGIVPVSIKLAINCSISKQKMDNLKKKKKKLFAVETS
jgi:hypothetical protein